MPDITASINAKGLDKTGFDDDLIAEMFHRKVGRHMLALVELQIVDKRGPNIKGKSKVMLDITQIDPVTDDNLDEHIRELQRTLRYNRGLEGHTGTTLEGTEPSVDQVLAAGAKHRPHPFLPVDAADDNPICDVCGLLATAGVHSTQDTITGDEDDTPASEEATEIDVEKLPDDHDPAERGAWEYPAPEGTPDEHGEYDDIANNLTDPFTVST